MPNLQYVGARYVPVTFSNPDDGTSNWKSGVSYDNLVIVTYFNDSYTSRKPVPSSVGNPASNPDYWAKTGDFNAALTALQNQVNNIDNVEIPALQNQVNNIDNVEIPALQSDVNNLKNNFKKIICIGDSYTGSMQWPQKIAAILGLTVNTDLWYRGVTGEGFSVGTNNNGFLDNLKYFENVISSSDKAKIQHIIVCGGANDMNSTAPNVVQSGISDFYTYAKSHYPNAKIHVGFIAVAKDIARNWSRYRMMLYAYQSCARYGKDISYLNNIEKCTHNTRGYMVDDLHPSTSMGTFFSWQLVNCLLTGDCNYTFTDQEIAYGSIKFYMRLVNGTGMIVKNSTIPIPDNTSISGVGIFTNDFTTLTELGATTDVYFNDPVIVDRYVSTGTENLPGVLVFYRDKLYVSVYNPSGWAAKTASSGAFVYNNNIYAEFDAKILA